MENLKIRVTTEQESKEVQELFFELGYGWHGKGKLVSYSDEILSNGFGWLVLWKPPYLTNTVIQMGSGFEDCKEITLQELRDMVVLKRNNSKDANVYQDGDIPCLYDLYLTENKELYFYHCGKKAWILSNLNHDKDYYELLKPIKEKVLKESINDKITTAEVARQKTASQWDLQVGGDHYKSMKIQPAKFALENKLDYCQANAIKYICRHESKNGKQDLEKAKHYIDLLIEHYYGGDDEI